MNPPGNDSFWKVLGAAQYRAGNWPAAQAALEKALAGGGSKSPWFFLALVLRKQGDHEAALSYYRQAVRWMDSTRPHDERLLRLRAEGSQLLGLGVREPAKGAGRNEKSLSNIP